jgi:hypothetical protein
MNPACDPGAEAGCSDGVLDNPMLDICGECVNGLCATGWDGGSDDVATNGVCEDEFEACFDPSDPDYVADCTALNDCFFSCG